MANNTKPPSTIADLNSMTRSELRDWIEGVLNGYVLVAGNDTLLPHIFLLQTYKELDPKVQLVFEDIVLKFLSDLAQNPNSHWEDEPGDELLLLISNIFRNTFRSKDPVDLLIYILEKRWRLKDKDVNLHWRAAQCLIEINYRAKPQFWIDIFNKGGSEYSSLVFSGLTLSSLFDAFNWLNKEISNTSVFEAFIARLPLLKEDFGSAAISEYINRILPFIPDSQIDGFLKLLKNLGIQTVSNILSNLKKNDLSRLARQFQIRINIEQFKGDICLTIEKFLFTQSSNYTFYKIQSSDIKIISSISEYVLKNPISLAQDFRNYFAECGEKIINDVDKSDQFRFSTEIFIIREKGIDVTHQLEHLEQLEPVKPIEPLDGGC